MGGCRRDTDHLTAQGKSRAINPAFVSAVGGSLMKMETTIPTEITPPSKDWNRAVGYHNNL